MLAEWKVETAYYYLNATADDYEPFANSSIDISTDKYHFYHFHTVMLNGAYTWVLNDAQTWRFETVLGLGKGLDKFTLRG